MLLLLLLAVVVAAIMNSVTIIRISRLYERQGDPYFISSFVGCLPYSGARALAPRMSDMFAPCRKNMFFLTATDRGIQR